MLEISYSDGVCGITTKHSTINIDVARSEIEAGLDVGVIRGAGEFEIGEASVLGMAVEDGGVVYTVEEAGIRIGLIGTTEVGLDDLGPIDVLITSSVKAVKEVSPKIVVVMAGEEKFEEEFKIELKHEKRLKIKNATSLPVALEIYKLG